MIGKIVPSRIVDAREARSLSMGELANSIGITRQAISKYEKGIISPSADVVQSISRILRVPIDYFYKKELDNLVGSPLFFRSNSNIPKKVKTACKYQVKWTNEIKQSLQHYVDFLEKDIPVIDINHEDLTMEDIEELALNIRETWGLGNDPIRDVVGELENRGIVFSQFAINDLCAFKGIDAFSSWEDGTPYILYHSVQKSAVRTRFSILHELGHLIMHSSIAEEDSVKSNTIDFADAQADRFAASFLLPATSFPNDIRGTSLASLEAVKSKWGAAMSTIIRRCETLELLSENQINYLKRQMTTLKYWHKEPLDDTLVIAGPEMLRDSILLLIDNGIVTRDSFINSSALSLDDLKSICSLPDDFFSGYNIRQKPILRVISS